MKKHNLSKFIALAMAGTLLAAPLTAFGAPTEATTPGTSVSTNGSGEVEGIVDKEVYCVVLPTQADTTGTFDFILDPQDLITDTNNAAHGGVDVSGNQLYFTNSNSKMSGTSDTLTVLNKSAVDVDVTVEATVSALAGGAGDDAYAITLADSATFEDDSTSIYLGLNVDNDDAIALTAADGASSTKTLAGAPDQYEVTHASGNYKYELKASAVDTDFEKLEFSLTGACNTNADWTKAKDAVPSVNLVWGFDKAADNTAKGPKVTLSNTGLITVTGLTKELNYKTGSFKGVKIATVFNFFAKGTGTYDVSKWDATNGGEFTYQLAPAYVSAYAGDTVTVTVTLSDDSTITATTTL